MSRFALVSEPVQTAVPKAPAPMDEDTTKARDFFNNMLAKSRPAAATPPQKPIGANIGNAEQPIPVDDAANAAAPAPASSAPAQPSGGGSASVNAGASLPQKFRVPRRDGTYDSGRDPNERAWENPRNQHDPRWMAERLQRRIAVSKNPYYRAAAEVAARTGRRAEDLLDPLVPPHASTDVDAARQLHQQMVGLATNPAVVQGETQRRLADAQARVQELTRQLEEERLRNAIPSGVKPEPPASPGAFPPPPTALKSSALPNLNGASRGGGDDEGPQNPHVSAAWLNRPENSGYVIWNEAMRAAAGTALSDVRTWSRQPGVSLHQLITSPSVDSDFFDLCGAILRLREVMAPRREEHPKELIPALKRVKVNALTRLQFIQVSILDPQAPVSYDQSMSVAEARKRPFESVLYDPRVSGDVRIAAAKNGREMLEARRQQEFIATFL